jgi:hypothetical protein
MGLRFMRMGVRGFRDVGRHRVETRGLVTGSFEKAHWASVICNLYWMPPIRVGLEVSELVVGRYDFKTLLNALNTGVISIFDMRS